MRIERDQPFDLIQRPAPVARERDELLTRQPAVLALNRGQRRDQRRAGELPGARLDAGNAAVALGHQPAPCSACPESGSSIGSRSVVSIFTAQNLNSGILPNGSISSIVSRFAAASRKWNGMKHEPGVSRCETFAANSIEPRRELTRTKSPSAMPMRSASASETNTIAVGWIASSANERRVIEPVCQCSSSRPVLSTNGNSSLGSSLAGIHSAGTRCALPSSVANESPNSTTVPSECSGSSFG